jgi:hypothetical protein
MRNHLTFRAIPLNERTAATQAHFSQQWPINIKVRRRAVLWRQNFVTGSYFRSGFKFALKQERWKIDEHDIIKQLVNRVRVMKIAHLK